MDRVIDRLRHRLGGISPLAARVRRAGLTYLTAAKFKRIEGELARIGRNRVPGDIVEFGVALGGSAIVLAQAALSQGRTFSGYDVFATIPPPTSDKDDAKSRDRYQLIADGGAKGLRGAMYYGYVENLLTQVTASFAAHGVAVDGQKVRLVKGLFDQSWPVSPVDSIALAHLDCDWYDPVMFCLTAIAGRVSPGGVIILDDYNDYGGCRAATDEFLAIRPDYQMQPGPNVILRRR
jgi:O-methyltransferase